LNESLKEEKDIDFRVANVERNRLIDRMNKMLSKRELEKLVLNTVGFQNGSISQKDYYVYLIKRAKVINVDLSDFPELQKYIVYISIHDAIDKSKVAEEMGILEGKIKETLYENETQKELDLLSKNLTLTKNLFNISLSREDYNYYLANKKDFNTKVFTSFIKKEAPRYKIKAKLDRNIYDLNKYRNNMARFYKYSFKRDKAFLENLVVASPKGESQANVAVLTTGGFHTENLCKLFREKGVSYVSIMPSFKNVEGYENRYFSLLAGKVDPVYSRIRSVLGYSLAIASILNRMGYEVYGEGSYICYNVFAQWEAAKIEGKGLIINREGTDNAVNQKGEKVTASIDDTAHFVLAQLPGIEAVPVAAGRGDLGHQVAEDVREQLVGREDERKGGESLNDYITRLKAKYGTDAIGGAGVTIEVVETKSELDRKAREHGFRDDVGGGFGAVVDGVSYVFILREAAETDRALPIHEITEALIRGGEGLALGGAATGITASMLSPDNPLFLNNPLWLRTFEDAKKEHSKGNLDEAVRLLSAARKNAFRLDGGYMRLLSKLDELPEHLRQAIHEAERLFAKLKGAHGPSAIVPISSWDDRLAPLHKRLIPLLRALQATRAHGEPLVIVDLGFGGSSRKGLTDEEIAHEVRTAAPTTFDLKKMLEENGFKNVIIIGVDNDAGNVERAKERRQLELEKSGEGGRAGVELSFRRGTSKLNVKADLVIISNVLIHYNDVEGEAIKADVRDALTEDGILVESTGPLEFTPGINATLYDKEGDELERIEVSAKEAPALTMIHAGKTSAPAEESLLALAVSAKGVLNPIAWLLEKLGVKITSTVEDFLIPFIEELAMLGLGHAVGGPLGYIGIRSIFTLWHGLQDRAPPPGRARTLFEKVAIPLTTTLVAAGVLSMTPLGLTLAAFLAALTHMALNRYVTVTESRLQKGVLLKGSAEDVEKVRSFVHQEDVRDLLGEETLNNFAEALENNGLQEALSNDDWHSGGARQAAILKTLEMCKDGMSGDDAAEYVVNDFLPSLKEDRYSLFGTVGTEVEIMYHFGNGYTNIEAPVRTIYSEMLGMGLGWDEIVEFAFHPSYSWRTQAEIISSMEGLGFVNPESQVSENPGMWNSMHVSCVYVESMQKIAGVNQLAKFVEFSRMLLYSSKDRIKYFIDDQWKPIDRKGGKFNVSIPTGKKPIYQIEEDSEEAERTRIEYRSGDVDGDVERRKELGAEQSPYGKSLHLTHVMHGLMLQTILVAMALSKDKDAKITEFQYRLVKAFDEFINAINKLSDNNPQVAGLLGLDWFGSSNNSFNSIVNLKNTEAAETLAAAVDKALQDIEDALDNMEELVEVDADPEKVRELDVIKMLNLDELPESVRNSILNDIGAQYFRLDIISKIGSHSRIEDVSTDLLSTARLQAIQFERLYEPIIDLTETFNVPDIQLNEFTIPQNYIQNYRIQIMNFNIADYFKGFLKRFLPKRKPYGYLGMLAFGAVTITAFALNYFGLISHEQVISLVHDATAGALALTALAWGYRIYLNSIRNGEIADPLYSGSSDSDLKLRVFNLFKTRKDRQIIDPAKIKAMADERITIVEDMMDMDEKHFESIIDRMIAAGVVEDNEKDDIMQRFKNGYWHDT
ncbi:hypothetical protein ACFL3J_02980, partial [Candidatus Omnitrophota bacterium]